MLYLTSLFIRSLYEEIIKAIDREDQAACIGIHALLILCVFLDILNALYKSIHFVTQNILIY